jgi:anti-sigma regulatory factor (Ser/Thr protein kinase)
MEHKAEKILSKVTIQADEYYVPPTVEFVKSIAKMLKFGREDLFRIELMTEEALVNVIQSSFEPGDEGTIDLILTQRPGQFIIAVEDRGFPIDITKLEEGETTGLGFLLMKKMADEVKFVNLGKNGKRFELIKAIPQKFIDEYLSEEEKKNILPPDVERRDFSKINIRMMVPSDAINLARCVYRSYGYTYASVIYYPDKIKELLETGLLESVVAENEEGEIIGHLGGTYLNPGDKVAETGMAVVDPRYRGHDMFKRMKNYMAEHLLNTGGYGLYSESVTIHPYTQKGNIALGAHETGLMLGFVPDNFVFKKIFEGEQAQRQTTVLFYFKINQEPPRVVFPPTNHSEIISEIYANNQLNREISEVPPDFSFGKEKTQLDITIKYDLNVAFMTIKKYGEDAVDLINFNLKELCLKKIDCIYFDLPLSEPATAIVCPKAQSMGFLFSGIIPELHDGDVLRLQYMNNVHIDKSKIVVVSDFAKKLLEYIYS